MPFRRALRLLPLLAPALLLCPSHHAASAQLIPITNGIAHTPAVDLAYEIYGAPSRSTTVIAVNGGPGLSHIYMLQNDVWQRLARDRQVVFYDQRGLGKSTRVSPNASQTIEAQVADLDALRAHLHLEQVDLVGDSYGGLLSMAYAAAHSEHIHKLILSDSAAPNLKEMKRNLDSVFPDVIAQEKLASAKLTDSQQIADAELRAHFRMIFYSQELCTRYLAGAPDLGLNPAIGDAVSKSIDNLDLTPALARFNFPTLVINGRFDMNVTPLVAWNIAHAIPDAQLVYFEKSGHLPSYEEPDRYVSVIDSFLRTTASRYPPRRLPPSKKSLPLISMCTQSEIGP